ncbi:methyl-accepting chemotaxis protein [Bdellovibrio sp. HCB337]|uniref:methyl-accepting chemotaxis protein n=1 Tax=Bdellovibrio sp. HCB337 TaxID=3394358 RepID=UPI0039A4298B
MGLKSLYKRQGLLTRVTAPLFLILLVGLATQLFYLRGEIKKTLIDSSTRIAQSNIEQFKTLRRYYTEKVVAKVKATGAMSIGIEHDGKDGVIPLPATMIHDLSKTFAEKGSGVLKLYSDAPFPNRKDRVLDKFAQDALAELKKNPEAPFIRYEDIPGSETVRVAVADKMVDSCVACHNSHPQSPIKTWKVGDVRGVLEVQMPLKNEILATQGTLSKTAGFNVAMFVVLFLAIASVTISQVVKPGKNIVLQFQEAFEKTKTQVSELSLVAEQGSKASTEQAASLEETVASIEELTSMVNLNSQNAKDAETLSGQSTQVAETGEKGIKHLAVSMNELSASSKKIEDIINVIDDIAFQTNLLALNAAVEAARAGEQGKGFAVVAEAVRTLAQRSAVAAKDIAVLIKDSVQKIDTGSTVTGQSGETLNKIVESIKKVSQYNQQIAQASGEQASGISQIAAVMNNLDKTTQQNAQTAEKTADGSRELAERVEMMEALLEDLRQIIDGEKKNPHS